MAAGPRVTAGNSPTSGPFVFRGTVKGQGAVAGVEIVGDTATPVGNLVLGWARRSPAADALVADGRVISYGQLADWSMVVARELAHCGVEPGANVGILAAPSARMIAAALGAMVHRCAYVPLDSSFPEGRIQAVLRDASVRVVLADPSECQRLKAAGALPVVIPELSPASPSGPERAEGSTDFDPESLAYIIYTSGSSAEPRGVQVLHRNLSAMTAARRMVYPGSARFMMVSPLAFDSSAAGIWGTLTAGGLLIVPSAAEVRDPAALLRSIREHRASHMLCVPSLYSEILAGLAVSDGGAFDTMSCVIVAGETLHRDVVDRHFAGPARSAILVNEYGPTEATIWASYSVMREPGDVSIGGPVPGVDLLVVDMAGYPAAAGQDGELLIGGAGVAAGYIDGSAPFPDPFVAGLSATGSPVRLYRTGDRVRWNEQGELDFLGRLDQQIKIRGQRVDLLLLESTLRELPDVSEACAVHEPSHGVITAFLEGVDRVDADAVRAFVRERLGGAYVPARIKQRRSLPRTMTDKIDRPALLAAAVAIHQSLPRTPTGPFSPAAGRESSRDMVSRAWAEVLSQNSVPDDVNFFDLGGHSLLVFRLQDALARLSGRRLPMIELFRRTTVLAQAQLFEADDATGSETADLAAPMPEPERRDVRAQRMARRRKAADGLRAGGEQ